MSVATSPLSRFLTDWVASGEVSATVGLVGSPDGIVWTEAAGTDAPGGAAVKPSSLFDLASLTKPFAATLALALEAQGLMPLATTVGEIWPQAHPRLAGCPLEDLLRHRSGLQAWTPLYARCHDPGDARDLLLGGELVGARKGTYSDLGYVLWGMAVEERLGVELGELLRRTLVQPLDLRGTVPSPAQGRGVATCLLSNGQEVELAAAQGIVVAPVSKAGRGVAQDGNARFLGGLAGHAGLFSTAEDLWRLAREWLRPGKLLQPDQVPRALAGRGPFVLGWARRTLRGSAGPALGRSGFGHTGFTGGSLWIDPAAERILVLLAHRASPFSELDGRRRRFHRLAVARA